MKEKGLLGGLEHLGGSLLELALGIGAVALGIRFFKKSFASSKKRPEDEKAKNHSRR